MTEPGASAGPEVPSTPGARGRPARRPRLKPFLMLGLLLLAAVLLLLGALRATDVLAQGPAIDVRPLLRSMASFARGGQWAIVVFFIGLSVLLAIPPAWGRWRERRGRRKLTAWARASGWTVHPVGVHVPWIDRLPGRKYDAAWQVAVLVSGQHAGRPTSVALCSRTETGQSYAEGHHVSVTLVSLRTVFAVSMPHSYPSVKIVRRHLGSRAWHARASRGHIEPAGAEFARRFRVSTQDPESVRGLLGPALATTLDAGDARLLDLRGRDLIISWRGLANPVRMASGLDAICSVADLIELQRTAVAGDGPWPDVAAHSLPPPPGPEGRHPRERPTWPGGTKALVLGTLGLLICWVPIVGLPLPVLGLIFGIPNIGPPARGKAIGGIVASSIGLLVNFVVTLGVAIALVAPSS
jgi:hypothetical protein